jgi:filamentous hemagglutinin family protein
MMRTQFDHEPAPEPPSRAPTRNPAWRVRDALYTLAAGLAGPSLAGNLPVPCIAGSCGASGPASWVGGGAATATQTPNRLTVNQTSQNTLLNWQSFNIGSGATVNFVQPGAAAVAINQIFQGSPSQIFGALTANGRIYLINQNGIMFGAGAQVNVGGLVASTLNITQDAIANGIAKTIVGDPTSPSFVRFTDASGAALPSGAISVAQGAKLNSTGGQILLLAPQIANEGTITTPDGQTILAAGNAVYLATSPDPSVRGLVVAVDSGGTVTNGAASNASIKDPSQLIGQIVAQRGNVTLLGLAVNQEGLVSANTSVRANGSILLIAADRSKGGTLTLGANSATRVGLDTSDTSQAVDATQQQKSAVDLQGDDVNIAGEASITATSGSVRVTATSAAVSGSTDVPAGPHGSTSDGSRIYIAGDASIDVSGATTTLPMSSNALQVQLRGSELADDPLQRNGALRGQTVTVDIRQYGTQSDGTTWVGTPIANLSGDLATIQRGVLERNETGGSVMLQSSGDVIVGSNARINVSGGASQFQAGFLDTSSLIGANGQVYSISNASPTSIYTGVANTTSVSLTDPRWGITATYTGIYGNGRGQYQAGYIQGADAGSLQVNAPHVILDGSLVASVQVGPYQRKPPSALAAGTLERPYDEVPLPGGLDLGPATTIANPFFAPDLILSSIDFASAPVLPNLRNPDGSSFNPLTDPWPTSLTQTTLNPLLIGANAAGRIELQANGTIALPAGVDLHLPVGGSFGALASNIDVAGELIGPGVQLSLQTAPTLTNQLGSSGIRLEPTAVLALAGAWVNDNPAVTPPPAIAALAVNGGTATLAARDGNIALEPGALIDVSGGAQLRVNGTLTAGRAGAISISTSAPDLAIPTDLLLRGTLRGYGVNEGGSLSLAASAFCVTDGPACAPLSANQTTDGTVMLAPQFFRTGGFSSYSLSADFGGLELAASTQLRPVQENLIVSNLLLPSAPTLSAVAPIGMLPDVQRLPVNLSFSAQYVPPLQSDVTPDLFAATPSLSLQTGSAIVLDPLASVAFTSNTRILDDGLIAAPGGRASMTVTAGLAEPQFVPGHQIWLGPHSVIDVSGAVEALVTDQGNTVGRVLPGGSVTLTALRGAVESLPGSLINVSGTRGTLDIQQVNSAGLASFEPRVVASAGGSLSVQAAEAVLLSGTLSAASGSPATVPSGTFSVVLDGNERYGSTDFGFSAPPYPFSPRLIGIAATQAPIVIAAGTDLPPGYEGEALLSTASITAAGFDEVNLKATSFNGAAVASPRVAGEIQFAGDVTLSVARALSMDSAGFFSSGGHAILAAPYVSLGQSTIGTQGVVGSSASGTGSLRVNASMIDLIGHSAFGDFATVTLDSTGDIRATGVEAVVGPGAPFAPQLPGALTVGNSLNLIAQQIYPSTLSAFSLTAAAGGTGTLNIEPAAGMAPATLLSAGGALILTAPSITQAGTVRAPLGSIVMNASSITLAPGSVTSTSTDGRMIPFGQTQGGFDWVYPMGSGGLVYGTDGVPLPSQSIRLLGSSVNVAKGATLDVKGGGDLLATEFIPGPSGTHDVLAGSGSFAILPTSSLQFAPSDPYYSSGSGVYPGESVYLSGGGGIAPGTYAVLPARYALLPGAYYITPVGGFQDLTPGQHISQTDGSVIVSGFMGYAGTTLGAARTSGFDIQSGTAVQSLAQYTLTSASTFFTQQASTAGVPVQRLPVDAGYLALSATTQLVLNGTLEATPATGGLGAEVDISSSAIRLINGNAAPGPEPSVLDINANSLTQLGAASILLGGVRSLTSAGLQIAAQASTVEVANGATVKAPELLLTATNTVTVDNGATVGASGSLTSSVSTLFVSGDGALLRVAAGGDPVIARTGSTGAQGQLSLLAGSTIQAPGGSVGVDVTSSATFGGTLQLARGSLSISGGQISIGGVPAGTAGIVLPAAALAGLSLANLSLTSRSSIDFYDGSSLSGTNVSLSGGALRGFGLNGVQVSAADTLTLSGSASPVTPAGTGTGNGTLALDGGTVVLGAGWLDASGFSAASISSKGLMSISGNGAFSVEGNLSLQAALLSADSGAGRRVNVSGAFTYSPAPPNASAITPPTKDPLGAAISITAQSITFGGSAQLHSGALSLVASGATGDVTLGSTANIDLTAVNTVFDGLGVLSPAGSLTLQSQHGSITDSPGSVINVSALDQSVANAGALSAQAPGGAIGLNGQLIGNNADISVDGRSLSNVGALETALVSGGFTGAWNLHIRGPGDLIVPAGGASAITGRSVSLTADQGNIDVEGTLTSRNASGGSITLSASNDLIVNGTLDTRPQASGQLNGQIELTTERGRVLIGSGATLEAYDPTAAVQSVADGGLWIRAPQATVATVLSGPPATAGLVLAGNLQGLRSVTIEGFQTYTNTTGTLAAADVAAVVSNPIYANAANFMATAAAVSQALGAVKGPTPQIVPGIEIDSNQSLTLTTPWDLSTWHFGGNPGALTLRSAGDLNFNGSLSDGFAGTTGAAAYVLTSTAPSWSYRLAAGADLGSSNPMAVQPLYVFSSGALPTGTYGTGSLTVAAGAPGAMTMIRTGTGAINIAAAGDVKLTNSDSVIYTAGVADSGVTFRGRGQLAGLLYPTEGGDISISAGRDLVGAQTGDLVTNWLWRVGSDASVRSASTAWTVNFADFEQGVGALAGGNVTVTAGRDILDLSVNVPTIGRQIGSATLAAGNDVQVLNEGDIFIRAGNNVAGGSLYDGSGSALVVAGNQITQSSTVAGLYPMVLLGDATATLSARAGATLAGVGNPTLLPQGVAQSAASGNNYSYFSTYGPSSALTVSTTTGTAELVNDTSNQGALVSNYGTTLSFDSRVAGGSYNLDSQSSLRIYPGTVTVDSLRGGVTIDNTLALYPAANGTVNLLAHGAVVLGSPLSQSGFELIESNADPNLLPTVAKPQGIYDNITFQLDSILNSTNEGFITNAPVPVHLTGPTPDSTISRIVSLTADVSIESTQASQLTFAAPARIVAGLDTQNLVVDFTNLAPTDVSAIEAGRDIVYSLSRDSQGHLNSIPTYVEVDGPGTLELLAGRNVNLGTSGGITSRGNIQDPGLAAGGAAISVEAGLNIAGNSGYDTFIHDYLGSSSPYTGELIAYMQPFLGGSPTATQALTAFEALPTVEQVPLIQSLFFDELLASGSAAAAAGPLHGNFTRGYSAIEALFPGSVPSLSGKASPYAGDISLYFSRVYTLAGGNVDLLAPGGLINVGLATPPASFGITKSPAQLGLVAQSSGDVNAYAYGDFEVNESRVFAADGGNILIWSTQGNIDAGRGAKTSISAPPPTITYVNGAPTVVFPAALTGSGIQTLATTPGVSPGNVGLFAPNGVVNANDAGIVAGNLTIAATAVLGASNIKVSGVSVGVPVEAGGLGASLAGVSAVGSSASQAGTESVQESSNRKGSASPVADAALGWLDVFIEGFGEEVCKASDLECLKRQAVH